MKKEKLSGYKKDWIDFLKAALGRENDDMPTLERYEPFKGYYTGGSFEHVDFLVPIGKKGRDKVRLCQLSGLIKNGKFISASAILMDHTGIALVHYTIFPISEAYDWEPSAKTVCMQIADKARIINNTPITTKSYNK